MKKTIIPFVVGLIKHQNKYLLTRRLELDREDTSDFVGKWQFPGGGVNFGETVEVAVKREVKEEVGLDVDVVSVVPYVINSLRNNWHGIGIVLYCRLNDVKQKIKLNHEADDYGWFTYEEAMRLDILPGGKETIKAVEEAASEI